MNSEAIDQIAAALAAAQAEMQNAPLNKVNPHFRSKYADLASVRDATVPALAKNGIAVLQTTEFDESGHFQLKTTLVHASGQWFCSTHPLPGNAKPQELGSALTYARRYAWQSICGISADEDDDGKLADDAKPAANGNGNGNRAPRKQADISAEKVRKETVLDRIYTDIAQLGSLAELERYENDPSLAQDLASLPTAQKVHAQERLEARRTELSAPVEPDPDEEERMDYVRHCLAVIEEAKTRMQLAAWWATEGGRRRALDLSDEQVKGLVRAVEQKRDSLPATAPTTRGGQVAQRDKAGNEMHPLQAG